MFRVCNFLSNKCIETVFIIFVLIYVEINSINLVKYQVVKVSPGGSLPGGEGASWEQGE